MKPLFFATSNKAKVNEANAILQVPIEELEIELDEIQSLNLEEIVRHKVNQAFEKTKEPVFVDDVSFEVKVWNGFPGPFVKFLLNAGGEDLLLRMMENEEERAVTIKAAIGFHDGEQVHVFIGEAPGTITRERRGKGWGFEEVFQPVESAMTYAEMSEDMKNKMSHRFRALEKFKEYLRTMGVYTA